MIKKPPLFYRFHSGDYLAAHFSDLLRSKEIDFLYDLVSDLHKGQPLDQKWLTQVHRNIDVSDINIQKETWQFELDWDVICDLAKAHRMIIRDKMSIPMPLVMFRRFVPTEYRCVSDSNLPMTHRKANNYFAALMLTKALVEAYPNIDKNTFIGIAKPQELDQGSLRFLNYGGSYDGVSTAKLIAAQESCMNDCLKEIETRIGNYRGNVNLQVFNNLCEQYISQYPVNVVLPAQEHGRKTYIFELRRYETGGGRLQDKAFDSSERSKNIKATIEKYEEKGRVALDFERCKKSLKKESKHRKSRERRGFVLFEWTRDWLRNSTYLTVEIPPDCRATYVADVGFEENCSGLVDVQLGQATLGSEGCLCSVLRKEEPTHDETLYGWIIPRFRMVIPMFGLFMTGLLSLLLFIEYGAMPWVTENNQVNVIGVFRVVALSHIGLGAVTAGRDESRILTRIMKIPRRLSITSMFPVAIMLLLSTVMDKGSMIHQAYSISYAIRAAFHPDKGSMIHQAYSIQPVIAWLVVSALMIILVWLGYWLVWYSYDRVNGEKWGRKEKPEWDLPPV